MVTVSDDKNLLDFETIHRYLSEESYWAKGVPREVMARAIEHSICFGAYDEGKQVGFARVITDRATFAYVADVFVLESHRGQGVARSIMTAIDNHPELQRLRRWQLVTRDAHPLYRQFGWRELSAPERQMERVNADVYRLPAQSQGGGSSTS